jgi:hypothetical protein
MPTSTGSRIRLEPLRYEHAEAKLLPLKHRRRADGSRRDTAIYAPTDDDWPRVQDNLNRRPQTRLPAGPGMSL